LAKLSGRSTETVEFDEILARNGKSWIKPQHACFHIAGVHSKIYVLASFDTLTEAIADVGKRRSDWRYVIRDRWTIVWPKPKVE
jgi:hypothetical protein